MRKKKEKSRQKVSGNLKVNSYPNDAAVLIEFYLFISLE